MLEPALAPDSFCLHQNLRLAAGGSSEHPLPSSCWRTLTCFRDGGRGHKPLACFGSAPKREKTRQHLDQVPKMSLYSVYICALFEFSFYGHISIIFLYHPPFQKANNCVQDVKRSMLEMRFID